MNNEMGGINQVTLDSQAVLSQITNDLLLQRIDVAENQVVLEAEIQEAMLGNEKSELALQKNRIAHNLLAIEESKIKFGQMENQWMK